MELENKRPALTVLQLDPTYYNFVKKELNITPLSVEKFLKRHDAK